MKNNYEIPKKDFIDTSKRGKLAKLARFEREMKKDLLVPKGTIFPVWLNVAISKTYISCMYYICFDFYSKQ